MRNNFAPNRRGPNKSDGKWLSETSKEGRCVKYSPSVKPPKYQPCIKKNELESSLWTSTFAAMGQLDALGLGEVKTFTKLSETPYHHCAPVARKFEASYGPLARLEQPTPKEPDWGPKYYAGRKDSVVSCESLPDVHYIPKSAIKIHWGAGVTDNIDLICDWLSKRFGPILFIIPQSNRCLIVVYKDIKSSYETVNAGIPPTLMTVTWCHPKFYNYGHYSIYKNYRLSKDPIWQRGFAFD